MSTSVTLTLTLTLAVAPPDTPRHGNRGGGQRQQVGAGALGRLHARLFDLRWQERRDHIPGEGLDGERRGHKICELDLKITTKF